MKKKLRTRNENEKNQHSAGELADAFERGLEGAAFTAGATALVVVLARWLAERGERPAQEAQVYGAALETLVDYMSRVAREKGVSRRAAA